MGMGMGLGMMSIFSSRAPQEELQKEEEKAVEEHNALSVGEHFTDTMLDQIFSASDDLSNDAVVHFVKALCRRSGPRRAGRPKPPHLLSAEDC